MEIRVDMKVDVKENGKIRQMFFQIPTNRVPYVMTKIIFWFLSVFRQHLKPWHIIVAAWKYDDLEGMKIMESIKEGYENGNK